MILDGGPEATPSSLEYLNHLRSEGKEGGQTVEERAER